MAEKIYKFKIVPQQERFYNENSNCGIIHFIAQYPHGEIKLLP